MNKEVGELADISIKSLIGIVEYIKKDYAESLKNNNACLLDKDQPEKQRKLELLTCSLEDLVAAIEHINSSMRFLISSSLL